MKTNFTSYPIVVAILFLLFGAKVQAQAPTISSFSPSAGCPGTTVTIIGTHFTGATNVKFGGTTGTAATSFIVSTNGDTITAVVGNGTSGVVRVITSVGSINSSGSFTVYAIPTVAAISGVSPVCVNSTITLSDATTGGIWSTINTNASVSGGLVTGILAGADTISYTVTNGSGCSNAATAKITINPLPTPTITAGGSTTFCLGDSVTLTSSASTSYLWNTTATTKSIKVKTGGAYAVTVTNANGCSATSTPTTVVVNALPIVAQITGTDSVCVNALTSPLSDVTTGITTSWSSSNTAIATIGIGGRVKGILGGKDSIIYTVTDGNGCTASSLPFPITVDSLPVVPPISLSTGTSSLCVGAKDTLIDADTTGTWSSDNKVVANVYNKRLIIIGDSSGTSIINYKVTNSYGCSSTNTFTVTVNPLPYIAAIAGKDNVCTSSSIILSDSTTGGKWSSINIARVTVDSITGVVTGIGAGVATIKYTVTSDSGCVASVTKLDTVLATSQSTTRDTICAGSSYIFNGTSYTIAGRDTAILKNAAGCDSLAILVLRIKQPSTDTITVSACGSYYWHGTTYTTSGTYTFDSLNVVNCDSLTTLNLTIKQPTTATLNVTSCSSYYWHGTIYTTSGIYTYDSLNIVGCDSLTTLNLTINQPTTATLNIAACSSYSWHGTTYTTGGAYTFDSLNVAGCDSLTTLNLTINQPTTATLNISSCSSYAWHGTTYTTGGAYTFDSLNVAGCDSLTTLNLTIKQPTTATLNISSCSSYAWHGTTYTTGGAYTFDSLNVAGCDSLTTLHLTILQPSTSTTTASICTGGSYTFNGTSYTTAGSYTVHLTNSVGCDSAATLVLTVNYPTSSTTSVTNCGSYTWNGTAYATSGTYTYNTTNALGCDSTATLILTVKANSTSTTYDTIYAGGSFTFNGTSYTSAGTYTALLTNSVGCDSAAILNLTVVSAITWTGATSTDWNTSTNWSPEGVPADNSNITIPSTPANQPEVNSTIGYAIVDTLTLNGTITFNGNSLTINGSVSGSGTLIGDSWAVLNIGGTSSPTLNFNQSTPGTTNLLDSLTINTTGTVTLGNLLNIPGDYYNGVVTVNAGTLAANGNLVLQSDTFGTARIAQSSGVITGNVTVQRFITAKPQRVFEMIGSAVIAPLDSAWHKQIYITGNGSGGSQCTGVMNSNGFDFTETGNPSMYYYKAVVSSGSHWVSIPNTSINLTPGVGYELNIRGSKDNGDLGNPSQGCLDQLTISNPPAPDTVTLSATGTVGQGNVTVKLNTDTIGGTNFTALANPYPCPIDFAVFQDSNSTNIYNKFWFYSTNTNTGVGGYTYGNYTTYNNDVFANLPPNYSPSTYIESGQAFLVESLVSSTSTAIGSPSVTFKERHKTTQVHNNIEFFGITEKPKLIRVGLQTTNNKQLDEVVVRFNGYGTKAYNSAWDAESLNSGNQVLVTNKGNTALAIATHPANFVTDTAKLGVTSKAVGTFHLGFREFESMDSTISILLRDKYLGISQDVRTNPVYKFDVTSDAASQGNDRFELVFVRSGTDKLTTHHLPLTTISVFPNPVTGNSFNLQLGSVTGKYIVRLVNALGQTVYSTNINHSASNAIEIVVLNKKLATGSYTVTATNENGTLSKAQLIVK